MERKVRVGRAITMLALVLGGACTERLVTSLPVGYVVVEPSVVELRPGETVRLSAEVRDPEQRTLYGHAVTWASVNEGLIKVEPDGTVRALSPGLAVVRAGSSGVFGEAGIRVVAPRWIAIDPGEMTFSAAEGGATPQAGVASVLSDGRGSLEGLAATIEYAAGEPQGWLDVHLNGTSAPTTLTVAPKTGAATAGTYHAEVIITAPDIDAQKVVVTFQVAEPDAPAIEIAPTSLRFVAASGGSNPAGQSLQVQNAGGGSLTGLAFAVRYASGEPTGWLQFAANGAIAPVALNVNAAVGALAQGTYHATVDVSSNEGATGAVAVRFDVHATDAPVLSVSTSSISFQMIEGGPNPASKLVQLNNAGAGSLSGLGIAISYGSGQPSGWLNAILSGTSAPATMTLAADAPALAPGQYSGTVQISSAGGGVQLVLVTLDVTAGTPVIQASGGPIGFNAPEGGANPAAQQRSISNGGTGKLGGLGASVSYAQGQPTGWLQVQLSGTAAPATLTATAAVGSLAPAVYNATVQLTAPGAASVTVPVSLTVSPAGVPVIGFEAEQVNFQATTGGSNPAPANIEVTNVGAGNLSGLAANIVHANGEPTGWLDAQLNGSSAPAELSLNATVGLLLPGTYHASVIVTGTGAAPDTIAVTFEVSLIDLPIILVDSAAIVLTGQQGGSNPSNVAISVTNGGTGTLDGLDVSVSYGSGGTGWLDAQLSATSAPATVTLAASVAGLSPGVHIATVNLTASGALPISIVVTLTVLPGTPIIELELPDVTVIGITGLVTVPPIVPVLVANAGLGSLQGLHASINYAQGQPTGWLNAALSSTIGPTSLGLTFDVTTMPPGTYTASVRVEATGAVAVDLNVNLIVLSTLTPAIGIDQGSVVFNATAGGANPSGASVQVSNIGTLLGLLPLPITGLNAAVSYAGGEPGGWLAVNLSGSSTPSNLTLNANVAGLPAGKYTAQVTLNGSYFLFGPVTRSFYVVLHVGDGG